MKKRNGFTLVELLGVIMILALIVIVASPPIIEKLKKAETEIDKASMALVESAVELYIDENSNSYPNINGYNYCLTLQQLVDSGKLKKAVLNTKSGDQVDLSTIITVEIVNKNINVSMNDTCKEYRSPSAPELTIGMIPVTYDGTNWVKADANKSWYNYTNQEWANAVTVTSTNRTTYLNATPGEVIPIADINTMWVWIPRYKYAIPAGSGAREINIVFESKDVDKSTGNAVGTSYLTHPAFTFGDYEVNGIWVGKFETTGEIGSPTILAGTASLKNQTVKAMYEASRAMENNATYGTGADGNIHMAKNSEWGAVAYLSQSQYGKYGNSMYTGANKEIYQNKSSTYITGSSNGTPSQYTINTQCPYNNTVDRGNGFGACGAGASTTGNISGIYDMSGGAWEYTMSMYRPTDATSVTDNSGFGATTTLGNLPTSEYWDRYTGPVATACSGGICYGSALSETGGWYSDGANFVNSSVPWSIRGGGNDNPASAGAFGFDNYSGGAYSDSSFRVVQLKP